MSRKRTVTRVVICGDFAPADGRWHDLGYLGIMHKCEACPMAARFVLRGEARRRDRFRCQDCSAHAEARDE